MKRIIWVWIMMMVIAGMPAQEVRINFDQLSSSGAFDALIKEFPVKCFYDLRKDTNGKEILKMGAFAPVDCLVCVGTRQFRNGKLKVAVTGRQSSLEEKNVCEIEYIFCHLSGNCSAMVKGYARQDLVFPLIPADAEPVEAVFDLAIGKCKLCGNQFSDLGIGVMLTANHYNSTLAPERLFVEISDIRLDAEFPIELVEMNKEKHVLNTEKLRDYYAARQNWETKHCQIFASYPKSNRFDAADFNRLPESAKLDDAYRYFSLAELKELNPDFEIKKIVPWSFYDPKIFADLSYFLNHHERVTSAFMIDKAIYATDNQTFLMRYDAAKNVWDYIYDGTPQETKHPRPKSFLSDFKKVYYADGNIRKLFDFSLVTPPAGISADGVLIPGKYAVTGDGKVYWLGNGKVYAGNLDFSNLKELTFALPVSLAGATLTAVNQIYGHPGSRRLLLDCRVCVGDKTQYALLELDPAAKTAIAKTAPVSSEVAWEHIVGGWLFASGGKYWLNPGAGAPLRQWDTAPDAAWRTFLTKSLCMGNFICGPTAAQDRFLFYNPANPSESLMLYGFNAAEYQLAEDGSGVLFTMPDGWYQVCRKQDAPAVSPVKAASPPSPPLKLMRAVDSVEAADSDFMSFRWQKQNGDGVLIINAKGRGENSKLTLELELPQNEAQYVIEFSDNPQLNFKKGFNVTAADRDRKECTFDLIDRHTLLVSGKTAYLYLEANAGQLPQEIVLKTIYKK